MAVVINEFEVVPPAQGEDKPQEKGKPVEKTARKNEPTDYELARMLERCAERAERVKPY